jgi:hypothetical protein
LIISCRITPLLTPLPAIAAIIFAASAFSLLFSRLHAFISAAIFSRHYFRYFEDAAADTLPIAFAIDAIFFLAFRHFAVIITPLSRCHYCAIFPSANTPLAFRIRWLSITDFPPLLSRLADADADSHSPHFHFDISFRQLASADAIFEIIIRRFAIAASLFSPPLRHFITPAFHYAISFHYADITDFRIDDSASFFDFSPAI